MKLLRAGLALLIGISLGSPLAAQAKPAAPPSRDYVRAAAREIMTTVRTGIEVQISC